MMAPATQLQLLQSRETTMREALHLLQLAQVLQLTKMLPRWRQLLLLVLELELVMMQTVSKQWKQLQLLLVLTKAAVLHSLLDQKHARQISRRTRDLMQLGQGAAPPCCGERRQQRRLLHLHSWSAPALAFATVPIAMQHLPCLSPLHQLQTPAGARARPLDQKKRRRVRHRLLASAALPPSSRAFSTAFQQEIPSSWITLQGGRHVEKQHRRSRWI